MLTAIWLAKVKAPVARVQQLLLALSWGVPLCPSGAILLSLLCQGAQSLAQSNPIPAPCRGSQVPAAPGQSDTGTNGLNPPRSARQKPCHHFQLHTNICSQVINSWKMLTAPLLQQREQVPCNECAE